MRKNSIYRVQITKEPEFETYTAFDHRDNQPAVEWERPVGWEPAPEYVEQYQTNKFFEPKTDKIYRSRSGARALANKLRVLGYEAVVQESAPVVWPANGQEKVPAANDFQNVLQAIDTLIKAGLVGSYDEILGGRHA